MHIMLKETVWVPNSSMYLQTILTDEAHQAEKMLIWGEDIKQRKSLCWYTEPKLEHQRLPKGKHWGGNQA
jgi:hypothetical protein